jgi:hypothetical protein
MKPRVLLIAAASVIALGGVATAADHLFTAEEHGLSNKTGTHPFIANSQGHGGDLAAGRGSPFVFFEPGDAGIPSTDTAAAHKGQTLPAAAFSGNKQITP